MFPNFMFVVVQSLQQQPYPVSMLLLAFNGETHKKSYDLHLFTVLMKLGVFVLSINLEELFLKG